LLVLDEIAQIDPHDLEQVAYFVINGQGKIRCDRSGQAKPVPLWRVPLFSSGEQSVATRLTEIGLTPKEGQRLRILNIPVEAGSGLFDDLHRSAGGAEFSKLLRRNASEFYGQAGPAFVRFLVGSNYSELVAAHTDISAKFPAGNPQEHRAANVFALAATAGKLATEADILPWDKGDALQAALGLYEKWKEARETSTFGTEHLEMMQRIIDCIEAHSDSRFSNIHWEPDIDKWGNASEPPTVRDRLGWWDDSSGKRIYLFTSKGLKETTKGFEFGRVLAALQAAGALVKEATNSKGITTRLPDSTTARLYWIDPSKLQP
jgi:putative DNA primase/helicase